MKTEKILIVEDNDVLRYAMEESLRREGFTVAGFGSGPEAVKEFEKNYYHIIVADLKMEPMNGIEVIEAMKKINGKFEFIMISAYGSVETAVKAMQLGASDFLTKPFAIEEFRHRINNLCSKISMEKKVESLIEQNRLLSEEINSGYDEIIGASPVMQGVFAMIDKVKDAANAVMIHGESGTGKELAARAIHRKGNRNAMPFIKVNCGALNENLLESELFGHERGAFTGAVRTKKGRFELADNGILFLDEIGDISPAMQVKLLRVLQEGEFERVGGEKTIKTNVRIICATHRDLQKMISEGKFREDLYYRLSVIPINIPPLRDRKEDIPMLAEFILKKAAARNLIPAKQIAEEGINMLMNYSWPGNIRELENLLERLTVITQGDRIEADVIGIHLGAGGSSAPAQGINLEDLLFNFEKGLIVEALKKSGGVKNKAAKILGINTSLLYYKLEKFGLL